MKVIDLLNKIANGEEVPKKIKCENIVYTYNKEEKDYEAWFGGDEGTFLFNLVFITQRLNIEVEIIEDIPKEDKKIEKYYDFLDTSSNDMKSLRSRVNELTDTLNEIIDKINGE